MKKDKANSRARTIIVLIIIYFVVRAKIRNSLVGKLLGWGFSASIILVFAFLALIFLAVYLSRKDEKTKKTPHSAGAAPKTGPAFKQEPEPEPELSESEKEILDKCRKDLTELRMKSTQILDIKVRTEMQGVCDQVEKILKTLRTQPDEIQNARQFLNYYIPTLKDVIARYRTLETSGTLSDDMTAKVHHFMGQVREAMDKQYKSLFENEELDLSVDMQAMKIALQRDGLL